MTGRSGDCFRTNEEETPSPLTCRGKGDKGQFVNDVGSKGPERTVKQKQPRREAEPRHAQQLNRWLTLTLTYISTGQDQEDLGQNRHLQEPMRTRKCEGSTQEEAARTWDFRIKDSTLQRVTESECNPESSANARTRLYLNTQKLYL